LFGGGPTAYAYGASELPAAISCNPSKYGAVVPGMGNSMSPAAVLGITPHNPMVGLVAAVIVVWLLAERHASLRAGGGGSLKGALKVT
jgi:hypothetical protein